MRLINAWIGNNGKSIEVIRKDRATGKVKTVKLWQVRWSFEVPPGRPAKECKKSDFPTKARADAFITELWKAHHRQNDWRFREDGRPTDQVACEHTVFGALEEYVESRWGLVWQDKTRDRNRGRFLELVAVTLTRTTDRERLLAALETFRSDRGSRPTPTTPVEWAAVWLRDDAYRSNHNTKDPHRQAGKRWIEDRSLLLSELSTREISRIRHHFTSGRPYGTQRTYWSGTLVPYFSWLHQTKKVPDSLLLGQPVLKRDKEAERPDPARIPDPKQLAKVANEMGVAHGAAWELFVLLGAYCAMRSSEALALRHDAFVWKDKRLWLNINAQEHRVTAANSDSGATRVRTSTKATRDRTPPPRQAPVPKFLEERLVQHYGDVLGKSDAYLFVGPRGAVASYNTVLGWWHDAVRQALPGNQLLADITPHNLRHAGMTYWFAAGYDHKRIQQWGGWTSLVEMLDTYRGILTSLEDIELDGLDKFVELFDTEESNLSETEPEESDSGAVIVSLDEYRRRLA
jgi:integrase